MTYYLQKSNEKPHQVTLEVTDCQHQGCQQDQITDSKTEEPTCMKMVRHFENMTIIGICNSLTCIKNNFHYIKPQVIYFLSF